jgi:hypothetical protein
MAVADAIAPPAAVTAGPAVRKADFHVLCTNPDCEHHFVIRRKLGFNKFPVKCPACGEKTGERAYRCNSPTCQGRWIVPQKINRELVCPVCGEPL